MDYYSLFSGIKESIENINFVKVGFFAVGLGLSLGIAYVLDRIKEHVGEINEYRRHTGRSTVRFDLCEYINRLESGGNLSPEEQAELDSAVEADRRYERWKKIRDEHYS